MRRSTKRYLVCILISVPLLTVVIIFYYSQMERTSGKPDPTAILAWVLYGAAHVIVTILVAREKGRWIGGYLCLIWAGSTYVLLFVPYQEYRRMQLDDEGAHINTTSGIEVMTVFPRLAYLLFVVQPRLVIDEKEEYVLEWRTKRFFELLPGEHTIRMYFNCLFSQHGKKTVKVNVANNQVRRVLYFARPIMFVPAIIRVY